jgi:hypothetical protein
MTVFTKLLHMRISDGHSEEMKEKKNLINEIP